jgi:hypothetical protein
LEDVKVPGEPKPTGSPLIRSLTIVASALTAASVIVNVILQITHFMNKRPVQKDQRDRVQAAGLALNVLKHMPGLVKQVRLLVGQIRGNEGRLNL